MRHRFDVRVGPIGFRVGSAWRAPVDTLRALYDGYPVPDQPEHSARLEPTRPWRRWLRPSVAIGGDRMLPEAAPLPLAHALLAAEMAMNLQVALGHRGHLLLHAAALERDGRVLLLSGESGSGKSTLAALLTARGWRLMADEFALVDLADGRVHPFPRLVSLKNEAVAEVRARVPGARFGPLLTGTPKGDIRHLVPDAAAVAAMDVAAPPALLLFPRFAAGPRAAAPMAPGEAFVRLTQASSNYTALGEAGFAALVRVVREVPAFAIDYPASDDAFALVDEAWGRL